MNAFPQNFAFAFGRALLSHFLIESASRGMRKRLERTEGLPTRAQGPTTLMDAH